EERRGRGVGGSSPQHRRRPRCRALPTGKEAEERRGGGGGSSPAPPSPPRSADGKEERRGRTGERRRGERGR
ncbi:hypothetical protein EE612_010988, partial [Oryza sativa]